MGMLLDRLVGNLSPAALLTSTFFWAWFDVVPLGFVLLRDSDGAVHLEALMLSILASVVVLIVVARSAKVRAAVIQPRYFGILSLLAGSASTALLFAGQEAASVPLLGLSALLIGAYQGIGIAVTGSVTVCHGTTNALLHIAVALPLSIVPTLVVALLVPGASEAAAALLPLLSALCFVTYQARRANRPMLAQVLETSPMRRKSRKEASGSSAAADALRPKEKAGQAALTTFRKLRDGRLSSVLVMVLAVTIGFGLVNTRFVETTGQSTFDEYYSFIIRAAVSALVVWGYLRFSWSPKTVFNVASLLMAVSLIAGAVLPGPVPGWGFFAGYVCFDLLIWAIVVGLTYRSGRCLLATIGIVDGVDQFGIFVGIGLCEIVPTAQENVLWAALGVVVMLLVMMLLLRNQEAVASLDEVDFEGYGYGVTGAAASCEEEPDDVEGSSPAAGVPTGAVNDPGAPTDAANDPGAAGVANDSDAPAQAAGIVRRLDELAQRYFLSSREVDILRLLVSGRSGPYIAEQLCISSNTVKTHIRHIYTKLDVHDRQELLDRVLVPESDAVL